MTNKEKLFRYIKKNNINQSALAKHLGFQNRQKLNYLLTHGTKIDVGIFNKILVYLKISERDLEIHEDKNKIPVYKLEAAILTTFPSLEIAASHCDIPLNVFQEKIEEQPKDFIELLSDRGVKIPEKEIAEFIVFNPDKKNTTDKEKEFERLNQIIMAQANIITEQKEELDFWRGNADKSGYLPRRRKK